MCCSSVAATSGAGLLRSRFGEGIRRSSFVQVESSPNSRHPVSVGDIAWAQFILVMEEKHKARLLARYKQEQENKPIQVLDIPDDYKFMDPELVDLLRQSVAATLGVAY